MIPTAYSTNLQPSDITVAKKRWDERVLNKDPANEVYSKYLEAVLANNLPSYPLSSPFNQAEHYRSCVYLGIQTLIEAIGSATISLEQKIQRGAPAPGAQTYDPDYVPFEDHPLVMILRQPNPMDTFAMFIAQIILQYHLTGRVCIWGPGNAVGAPDSLFVIPTALVSPAYSIGNANYPKGAWRIQQFYPASGIMGVLPGPLAGMAGCVIDAREMYIMQNPHPIYRWAPWSPMQGADRQVDVLELIDNSCWSVMNQGLNPSAVYDMPGAGQDVIDAVQTEFDNKHAGTDNHGKVIVTGGGRPDRRAGSFLTPWPKATEMAYTEQWDRYAGFTLAAVCGLDLQVTGLRRAGGYQERWAAIQNVRHSKYEPFCSRVADMLTAGPVKDWGLAEDGVRCRITLPKIEDPTLMLQIASQGSASGTLDYNEVRAIYNRPPKDGGDVPVPLYMEMLAAQLGKPQKKEPKRTNKALLELRNYARSLY